MLDAIYHMALILLKNHIFVVCVVGLMLNTPFNSYGHVGMDTFFLGRHFCSENINILPSFTIHYNGHHYVTLLNLLTPSGLSILLHGLISLPDATSCDKIRSGISILYFKG